MNNLIEYIEDNAPYELNAPYPRKVDEKKLYAYLYGNKITADTMYFKLITCSRLDRDDYFFSFNEFNIYKESE